MRIAVRTQGGIARMFKDRAKRPESVFQRDAGQRLTLLDDVSLGHESASSLGPNPLERGLELLERGADLVRLAATSSTILRASSRAEHDSAAAQFGNDRLGGLGALVERQPQRGGTALSDFVAAVLSRTQITEARSIVRTSPVTKLPDQRTEKRPISFGSLPRRGNVAQRLEDAGPRRNQHRLDQPDIKRRRMPFQHFAQRYACAERLAPFAEVGVILQAEVDKSVPITAARPTPNSPRRCRS